MLDKKKFDQEYNFWYNILLKDEIESPESPTHLGSRRLIEKDSSVTFEYKIVSTFIKAENPKSILCIPPADIQEKKAAKQDDNSKWDFKNIGSIISAKHETDNLDSVFFAGLLDQENIDRDFYLEGLEGIPKDYKGHPENLSIEETEKLYREHNKKWDKLLNKKYDLIVVDINEVIEDWEFRLLYDNNDDQNNDKLNSESSFISEKKIDGIVSLLNKLLSKLSKDGSLILIDNSQFYIEDRIKEPMKRRLFQERFSIGNSNNPVVNKFREKNAHRLYGIAQSYFYKMNQNSWVKKHGYKGLRNNYETNAYVLKNNSVKNTFIYTYRKMNSLLNFDEILINKKSNNWIENTFKSSFKFPIGFLKDDFFKWNGSYISRDSSFQTRLSIYEMQETKSIPRSLKQNYISYYKNNNLIVSEIDNWFQLTKKIANKLDIDEDQVIHETLDFTYLFSPLLKNNSNYSLPNSSMYILIDYFLENNLSVFETLLFIKESILKYYRNYFRMGGSSIKFIEDTSLETNPEDFIKNLEVIKNNSRQRSYQVIHIDLEWWFDELNEDNLIKFLLFSLNAIDKSGKIYMWCQKDILESNKFLEFRKTFSSMVSMIIKGGDSWFFDSNSKFLLVFEPEQTKKYFYDEVKLKSERNRKDSEDNLQSMDLLKLKYKDELNLVNKTSNFYKNFINGTEEEKEPYQNEDLKKFIKKEGEKRDRHISKEHEKTRGIVINIHNDIYEIKQYQIDVEEKIKLIIDNVNTNLKDNQNIKNYIKEVKKWFLKWDESLPLTQTILPISEYLYDSLFGLDGVSDYSSFIAYSSQALEIEVYSKIFLEFHKYVDENLNDEKKKRLCEYNSDKIVKSQIKKNLSFIDNSFHKYILNENATRKYTLGGMINLIKYLPKDNSEKHKKEYETLGSLKLLYNFIQNNMQGIDVQFFEKLKEFVDKRNSAAHPGELTFQEAGVFWNDYKTLFNSFMLKISKNK